MGDVMRNYFLVFQPMYGDYQYSVRFNDDGTTDVVKINKFSDVVYGSKNDKKIKKNTFGEIDKVMTSLSSIDEFFEKYIDKEVFSGSVRDIFIGKVRNGWVNRYECAFNNPKLQAKNKFVSGSRIDASYCDEEGFKNDEKEDLIELLIDPNSKFLSFVSKTYEEIKSNKGSTISSETLTIAKELRAARTSMKEGTYTGSYRYADNLMGELREKLTSYKEYREMFLMRDKYLLSLEKEKEEAKKLKEQAEQAAILKARTFEPFKTYTSEQLSLFEQELPDTSKSSNNTKK